VFGLQSARTALGPPVRRWTLSRRVGAFPSEATVPLDLAEEALLLCSRLTPDFQPQLHVAELAFAHELAERGRSFAVSNRPDRLFGKSVVWFLPNDFVRPRLWDYSRQVQDFATGLERQGNILFSSSHELMFWENKAHMQRELERIGVATPPTRLLTSENWSEIDFDLEPVLLKEEHSAGSAGVHYFPNAGAARRFVAGYRFRRGETLLMQELVHGATRDLRVTMVGDVVIESATFWREKSAGAARADVWTTTATKYHSVVRHADVPPAVGPLVAECLRKLRLRSAGVDLIWVDDDVDGDALLLELSPYYQPNPPKPQRYADLEYNEYKSRPYTAEGYLSQQYHVFRDIARAVLDQGLLAAAPGTVETAN
jgi:hypothetical protein